MSSPHDASLLARVKSVFRTEFKERDERYFNGRRGDLEVSIRPESTYPKDMPESGDVWGEIDAINW